MNMRIFCFIVMAAFLLMSAADHAGAQGTAFTYQGVLNDQGAPANGVYDLQFAVFDAVNDGTQQGVTTVVDDLMINNGRFTVLIDPGTNVFTGAPRWLNVAVRPGVSSGAFTSLVPRRGKQEHALFLRR